MTNLTFCPGNRSSSISCLSPTQVEPQHSEMIQYSDSSGEEDGPGLMKSSSLRRSGRGFERSLPLEAKANVRFRYSRGAEVGFLASWAGFALCFFIYISNTFLGRRNDKWQINSALKMKKWNRFRLLELKKKKKHTKKSRNNMQTFSHTVCNNKMWS